MTIYTCFPLQHWTNSLYSQGYCCRLSVYVSHCLSAMLCSSRLLPLNPCCFRQLPSAVGIVDAITAALYVVHMAITALDKLPGMLLAVRFSCRSVYLTHLPRAIISRRSANLDCADFKNVSIVAHYIKERTKNAQFVIISLRNNMFELADRLVGIYKTNNATKSVAINPG